MRFILSPPCLGCSFVEVVVPHHVLNKNSQCLQVGTALTPQELVGYSASAYGAVSHHSGRDKASELQGQATHRESFPEPAVHPANQVQTGCFFLVHLVQAVT